MIRRLAIFGASGHGKVVADVAELSGWNAIDFFDDAYPAKRNNSHWLIIGDTSKLLSCMHNYDGICVAIGNNRIREEKTNLFVNAGAPLISIVHPLAQISQYAKVGQGSVVFANAVVNCDTILGQSAILNTACSVDHDCILGDFVHISPGANLAGNVEVGHRSWLGIGSSVKQGMIIGEDCIIGAGSVVVKNVPCNQTVMGNPAKIYHSKH